MIQVNLLDSVTERAHTAAVVEEKVSNPGTRFWLLGVAVFALMAAGMAVDFVSAAASKVRAQQELEREEQIAAQMAAINKEQAELEKKLKDINTRIDAIKRLRTSQQGPVSILSEINSRIPTDPGFRLDSIEQKNGELIIEGQSPNEYAVTEFGRKLEFSGGLFANVSIEAKREEIEINLADFDPTEGPIDMLAKPEVFKFKIKCKYVPSQPQPAAPAPAQPGQPQAAPANQVAQR
jgi:Tfp pilus assembly protein PilN